MKLVVIFIVWRISDIRYSWSGLPQKFKGPLLGLPMHFFLLTALPIPLNGHLVNKGLTYKWPFFLVFYLMIKSWGMLFNLREAEAHYYSHNQLHSFFGLTFNCYTFFFIYFKKLVIITLKCTCPWCGFKLLGFFFLPNYLKKNTI